MHFNPYGGTAAELAATLVNADPSAHLLDVLKASDYKPLGSLDARQERDVRDWIARLREVFRAPTVELLNDLLAQSSTTHYISTHDGRAPHLHYAREDEPTDVRLKAYTAAGMAALFCEDAGRIGSCGRDGCDTVFVDTSRNGRRRFCSTKCANRVAVANHRSRAQSA
ncbi:CGNR zinc finger domain-containing protein [Lentzea sp. NEAU-D7]|uniref:CGNR zinc finger domain-containing protein n=1 Tax=Lentzea sp. NEAU-D7 TaxID=2994667 RepID=UPI00224A79F8|nr:CGNR zinc finger domain-containing protein [Lentzea sp. NEAU-D7]MCX2950366.1 CGNR zinc finger domain-containing protein [Lentzea sp. NEAU-D7]